MRFHHTKNKGDLGLLKAHCDLAEKGYTILIPLTEHSAFDLVGYKDEKFTRFQVKYRSVNENGVLAISMKSYWADKHGTHAAHVDKALIDIYCVYCPDTDACYYFDPKVISNSINLRVDRPKNNQQKGIHFAEDFREVP